MATSYNPSGLPRYVCEKRAKGRVYYYFDTGKRRDGKRVLSPLPPPGRAGYTVALAKAQRARFQHETRVIPPLPRGKRPGPFNPAALEAGIADGDDLYFIRVYDAVKIGRAADVWSRMVNAQVNCPAEMDCICRLIGRGPEEPHWQSFFRDVWIRGEWFEWSPEIAAAIEMAKKGERWWRAQHKPEQS